MPSAGFHKARFEIPRWTTLEGVEALGNSSRVSKQKSPKVFRQNREGKMKLTILFVVVVGAVLVWWLKKREAQAQDLIPPSFLRQLALTSSQQLRQIRHVGRNPPCLIFREQLSR
jgi:hypothetical protein